MLWGLLEKSFPRWIIHREMTVNALCGLVAPLDCQADWQRAVDELHEPDLEIEEDPAAAGLSGLLRKRPDGFAATCTQTWTASRQTVTSLSKTNSRAVSVRDGL